MRKTTNHQGPTGSARRRAVTIVFLDLSQSSSYVEAMEGEYYAEMLEHLHRFFEHHIESYGGAVAQIQGDGALAVFGYPHAGEDDARQAVAATLHMHAQIERELSSYVAAGPPLRLHSGIHSGLVLVHEGHDVAGRFELIGNATIVAVRLSDAAEEDEILVSEATLGADIHLFDTAPVRQLTIQGRGEPLRAYPVLGRSTVVDTRFDARSRSGLSPFVGRKDALAELQLAFHKAERGTVTCVAVSAGIGAGKTRLVTEFLMLLTARGWPSFRGYFESHIAAEPMQAIQQVLRAWLPTVCATNQVTAVVLEEKLTAIDPALLEYRADLAELLGVVVEGPQKESRKQPNAAAIIGPLNLLLALGRERPFVVFIDDWQWADSATRDIVGRLVNRDDASILIVIATREPIHNDPVTSDMHPLELARLSEDESLNFVERLVPKINPFEASEIGRLAGGNPLFVEELCHSLEDLQDTTRRHFDDSLNWLSVLIATRVESLSSGSAEFLRAAAVFGSVIPTWVANRLLRVDNRSEILQELAANDFLFVDSNDDIYRFKHGIVRDVVYDSVGLHERQQLHAKIAQSIEQAHEQDPQLDQFEALAHHYLAAGTTDKGAHYATLAGDKAMRASALDEAAAQYRAALDALDRLELTPSRYTQWFSIAKRLGLVCVYDPSPAQLGTLRRTVELASDHGDRAALARAEYWLGYICYALGNARPAIAWCERALSGARAARDEGLAMQILATAGQARASACDYPQALELLGDAVATRRQNRDAGRPAIGLAYTLACRGAILGDQGKFHEAGNVFSDALNAIGGSEHEVEGSVLALQAAVMLWQGDWDAAYRTASRGARIGSRVRSLYVFAMCKALGGYAHWCLKRDPGAIQDIVDATTWLERQSKALFTSLNYGWLAEIYVELGNYEAARRYAARALKRARKSDRLGEAMACRALAAMPENVCTAPVGRWLLAAHHAATVRGSCHEFALNELLCWRLGLSLPGMKDLQTTIDTFTALGMVWHAEQAQQLARNGF